MGGSIHGPTRRGKIATQRDPTESARGISEPHRLWPINPRAAENAEGSAENENKEREKEMNVPPEDFQPRSILPRERQRPRVHCARPPSIKQPPTATGRRRATYRNKKSVVGHTRHAAYISRRANGAWRSAQLVSGRGRAPSRTKGASNCSSSCRRRGGNTGKRVARSAERLHWQRERSTEERGSVLALLALLATTTSASSWPT